MYYISHSHSHSHSHSRSHQLLKGHYIHGRHNYFSYNLSNLIFDNYFVKENRKLGHLHWHLKQLRLGQIRLGQAIHFLKFGGFEYGCICPDNLTLVWHCQSLVSRCIPHTSNVTSIESILHMICAQLLSKYNYFGYYSSKV